MFAQSPVQFSSILEIKRLGHMAMCQKCDRWKIARVQFSGETFLKFKTSNIRVEKDRHSEIDLFSLTNQLKKLTSPYLLQGKRPIKIFIV